MKTHPHRSRDRRGIALVASLALTIVVVTLGVAVCWAARSSLLQSRNFQRVDAARLQAESGLVYMCHLLPGADLPITVEPAETMQALTTYLSMRLSESQALREPVSFDGTTIRVPQQVMGEPDRSFSATLWMGGPRTLCVLATGHCGPVTRSHQMDFTLVGGHPVFGFGISSKGPITFQNAVSVHGANDPTEARLLSTASGTAFRLEDALTLDGDVYATDPNATVTISGTGTIAGTNMGDSAVWDHVHIGEGEPDFPEVDASAFEAYATNVIDANTDTSGTKTFTNVRIKAGTNPTFENGVNLQGVVFVEQPNKVTFAEGTEVTGVICSSGDGTMSSNTVLKFEVNTVSRGVEELPKTAEFAELRKMTGSFILAPDFHVKFENDSGVINGMIAAGHVKFENSFNGTLCGGVLTYSTLEVAAENISNFTIDHSKYGGMPSGFQVEPPHFVPDPTTYTEH